MTRQLPSLCSTILSTVRRTALPTRSIRRWCWMSLTISGACRPDDRHPRSGPEPHPCQFLSSDLRAESPLTSRKFQTATQVNSQDQADAINAGGGALAIVVQTDFQKTPIGTPVPLHEQGIGTAAGEARETEVTVFLNITQDATGTRFVPVIDDLDGCPNPDVVLQFRDGARGVETVDASQIFVANGAGNPTSVSLESWLTTHPMGEGDTWNTVFVDNTPGDFQARGYSVEIFPNEPADPGIVVKVATPAGRPDLRRVGE